MGYAFEKNVDLAFNTQDLKDCGQKYADIATELRTMAEDLDTCLEDLKNTGWTTPAGTAFHDMVKTNWKNNIDKYADLLDTLNEILIDSAKKYDDLVTNHIDKTKL